MPPSTPGCGFERAARVVGVDSCGVDVTVVTPHAESVASARAATAATPRRRQ
jgi:hypothetical protein